MGKLDIAQTEFLRNTNHFADIWNGLVFKGKQVLSPGDLTEYCLEHGKNITGNCRNMISQLVSSKELTNYLDRQINKKGDEPDMCKAITELIEDGRIEGRAEGRAKGRAEGKYENMVTLINDGDISIEKAASKFNTTPKEFIKQAKEFGFTIEF